MINCPFCNIRMYLVVNEDYPRLDTYLCYECGFHADTVLMSQKKLYQSYQALYSRFRDTLKPKRLPNLKRSDENLQGDENDVDPTETGQHPSRGSVNSVGHTRGC